MHIINMDYHISISSMLLKSSLVTISLLLLMLMLSALPPSLSQPPTPPPSNYSLCSSQPYKCGAQPELYYPFWGSGRPALCGGSDQFKLTCEAGPDDENGRPKYYYTSIQMGSRILEVADIDTNAYTMKMVPLPEGPVVCSWDFNFSLNPLFRYNEPVNIITLVYGCPEDVSLTDGKNLSCSGIGSYDVHKVYYEGVEEDVLKQHPNLKKCKNRTQMPAEAVDYEGQSGDAAFGKGFKVSYSVSEECIRCWGSKGACGRNETTNEFTCYCPDGSNYLECSSHQISHGNRKVKLVAGVTGAAIAVLLTICCFICKLVGFSCVAEWQAKSCWLPTKNNQDIEAFLKNHGALTLKRYKFSEVKKMTNSFKVKLGQGGFGAVYKGKLLNGSSVAVKILTRSKGNGEEFINEVASISRTSHVNVVTLLGFCIEGRKKVLIYEFMSNGSLDKFIYKKEKENTQSLSWDNLYQIVVGIARGLEYLHRGCSTKFLHFDIKPHNILLDENFCPKIADFGLAKLCPRKESIISMSDARGTIGYVAPEVWNRHFGGVSHKSDVYSYGMMLLEIVGGRKNINAEASHTSEIYFPDWIYRNLEQGTGLGVGEEVTIEENEVIKRMTMVGLWCIQTFPNNRPTVSRVVEMLEGNVNSLEMPPKPVLSSPVRSVVESSTTIN